MKFRLSEILKPTEMEAQVSAMELELGYRFQARVDPTRLALSVTPKGRAHRVEGTFEYRAAVPCSRCLKEVILRDHVEFMQEYQPLQGERVNEGEIEVTPADDYLVLYEDDTIVTQDLVRQQLYLEIPEKPLCDERCKGLCPRCGADLNESPCGCTPECESPAAQGQRS